MFTAHRILLFPLIMLLMSGCHSGQDARTARNMRAVRSYYAYDFTTARAALRRGAYTQNDEQVVLNNLRLGMASLADGDTAEAERALSTVFDLLSTAGLNADRTTAAIHWNEGVRIWKGEPFEQALAYHYLATLYAVKGDWENARAAATNALFRLTDFGADANAESLARQAAERDDYLDTGYTAVDTDFALGFIMQALAADLSGAGGSEEQYDAAIEINPELEPLISRLRRRAFNTLLIIDYGKGPTKIAFGPDQALVRFDPQEPSHGDLIVNAAGIEPVGARCVTNVDDMAVDHRWNNLEDVRVAKSAVGDVLLVGGALVASSIDDDDEEDDVFKKLLIGAGLAVAGLVSKDNARGDTRYLEFMPQSIYLVPLMLDGRGDVRLQVEGDESPAVTLSALAPGSSDAPHVHYVRLHGRGVDHPEWLIATETIFGNDATGVRAGDWPWILGGMDVSTPSRAVLRAYQAGGHLEGLSFPELLELYEAEGILVGSGMEAREDQPRNPSYRHILEGGVGLFTPEPGSIGYKRIMCQQREPYEPKSELARNLAASVRVQHNNALEEVE